MRQKIYNSAIFDWSEHARPSRDEINRLDRERDRCERCERGILKVLLSHNVIWIFSGLMLMLIFSDKCETHAAFDVTVTREVCQAPKIEIASF